MHIHPAEPEGRSPLFTILFLSYFSSFGNPLIIPLYPHIMEYFQVSPLAISLLISMYALPGACVIPLLGVVQDRLGRRPVLLGALILCLVSSVGLAMSTSFTVFLLCRMGQGLSVTPLEAVSNTLITDSYTGDMRLRNIGRNASALYMGVATIPLLSTALLYLFGWRFALMLPCIMGLPLLLLCWHLPMPYSHSHFQWGTYRDNLKQLFSSRKLLSLFGLRMGMALVMFSTIHTYLPFLIMDKLGGGQHLPGMYFALFSGSLALGSLALGKLAQWLTPLRLAQSGTILVVVAMLSFMVVSHVPSLVPLLVGYGFGAGMLLALVVAHTSRTTTPDTRGTVLSLASTFFRAAQAVAPPFFGLVFAVGGFNALYGGAALVAMAMLLLTPAAFISTTKE